MRLVLLFSFIVLGLFCMKTTVRATDFPTSDKLVVLELFTSQSCSSCPPADALLEELAHKENVIALGCHVTYWDHLSWRDTLSLPACTERQRNYNVFLDKGVFTPQLVVNGTVSAIGSSRSAVQKVIASADVLQPLSVYLSGQNLEIQLPTLRGGDYFVTAFGKRKHHTESIPRGENAGETVGYTDPVTEIIHLGPWDGNTKRLTAQFETSSESAAVIVQDAKTAKIVAAGQVKN